MPVAVIGMHRSGTSMVTRMLAACGLQVGPSSELLGPTSENPTGYWERRPMVLVNDAVLDHLGLAWDHVPHLPRAGWEHDEALAQHASEAKRIVASFPAHSPWGWKDPRTSITLSFWEQATGALSSCVVCVRNPLDVAASLAKRGGMSPRLALHLWEQYTEQALAYAAQRQHVVTHYDAYFEDPRAELARVCGAIDLTPSNADLAAAATGADTQHRHSASGLAALVQSPATDSQIALYLELLHAAGPTMQQVASRDAMVVESDGEPHDRTQTTRWIREFRVEHGLVSR